MVARQLTTKLALGDAVLNATPLDGISGELQSDIHSFCLACADRVTIGSQKEVVRLKT